VNETGDNIGGSEAWYQVTFNNGGNSGCALVIAFTADDSNVMDVTGPGTSAVDTGLSTDFVTGASGTFVIDVHGGTSGGSFTLNFTAQ
jgi:hypothetical protein